MAPRMLFVLAAASLAGTASSATTRNSALLVADPAAVLDTFRALDADGSGFLEEGEIKAFAVLQGLSDDDVLADFSDVDIDGDGRLSIAELSGTLSSSSPDSTGSATGNSSEALPAVSSTPAEAPAALALTAGGNVEAVEPAAETAAEWFTHASRSAREVALRDAGSLFVEGVAQSLERKGADEAEADELEAKAAGLRANATALVRGAFVAVEVAAKEAVANALREPMVEARRMQAEADAADKGGLELREKARQLQTKALAEQGDVLSSVRQLRGEATNAI